MSVKKQKKNSHISEASEQSQLQKLRLALETQLTAQTLALATSLAEQGTLPVIELFTIGQLLNSTDQVQQAIALYRLWIEHTESNIAHAVLFNLGTYLTNVKDDAGAEMVYRQALKLNPDFLEAHLNLATVMERRGEPMEALALWNQATAIANPGKEAEREFYLQALNNLGRLLEIRKQYPEAEAMLVKSLLVNPKQPKSLTHLIHLRQKQCKWPIYEPIEGITSQEMHDATSALAMLSASSDPQEQLQAARRFVNETVLPPTEPLAPADGYQHTKLRIGYLSSDLCSHAVSILTAELYELHDRNRVEVFAFSWSREDGTPLRTRVVKAMDHYIPIAAMSDEEAARCIREHEIDILVDLHGLTSGTRPNILSWRPAPVQITYLGFPGSTALPCIDYVVADKFVLPPELAAFFTEKPLYMPNSFQINDRQRQIGIKPTRASCGLPENGFVFCSFNNNYKFTEDMFACWMRILQRVPESVLWLVSDHEIVRQNLRFYAQKAGVEPARLLFAERVTPANYLARYQVADLFLDSAPFNAGTTASDALWAGLPLLTCSGRTFSSRMAGSLLLAANLPELITYNLQEYEDKAVSLANDLTHIAALKLQLDEGRLTCSLFDSPQTVRDLEALYEQVAIYPSGKRKVMTTNPKMQTTSAMSNETLPNNETIAIFCVTHVAPLIEYPPHVKVLRLGSYQEDGALNLRDLAPEWDVFHPLLGATAGSFAIRNYLRKHPEVKHVAMCSYRKFMTKNRIGVPIATFPQQHAITKQQVSQYDMNELLDYTGVDFLICDPLHFKKWGITNVMQQYQQAHHMEDFLRFLAESISENILEPADVYALLSDDVLIPGGAEFGVYPANFYLYAIDRLECIVAAYLRKFRIIHDGYQIRAISFCCERVGSYLLLKHLRSIYPDGIPDNYYGNFNLVGS